MGKDDLKKPTRPIRVNGKETVLLRGEAPMLTRKRWREGLIDEGRGKAPHQSHSPLERAPNEGGRVRPPIAWKGERMANILTKADRIKKKTKKQHSRDLKKKKRREK